MTNGDNIRNMSDDELADMLHHNGSYTDCGRPLLTIWIGDNESTVDDDIYHIKKWLESEEE